jgi:lysophospholipase L1-like esterase
MIDLDPVLAAAGPRLYPKATWPVHFNEDGYRVVADTIAAQLTALGPPP